jgi:hypothetical protein
MKKIIFLLLIIVFSAGCAQNGLESSGTATEELVQSTDCYEDGEHPAALSIADEYQSFTDYEEVMVWFCNGAEFEDILNALLTEEMVGADAEEILRRVAGGETWNEIWLDLGVVD